MPLGMASWVAPSRHGSATSHFTEEGPGTLVIWADGAAARKIPAVTRSVRVGLHLAPAGKAGASHPPHYFFSPCDGLALGLDGAFVEEGGGATAGSDRSRLLRRLLYV